MILCRMILCRMILCRMTMQNDSGQNDSSKIQKLFGKHESQIITTLNSLTQLVKKSKQNYDYYLFNSKDRELLLRKFLTKIFRSL